MNVPADIYRRGETGLSAAQTVNPNRIETTYRASHRSIEKPMLNGCIVLHRELHSTYMPFIELSAARSLFSL